MNELLFVWFCCQCVPPSVRPAADPPSFLPSRHRRRQRQQLQSVQRRFRLPRWQLPVHLTFDLHLRSVLSWNISVHKWLDMEINIGPYIFINTLSQQTPVKMQIFFVIFFNHLLPIINLICKKIKIKNLEEEDSHFSVVFVNDPSNTMKDYSAYFALCVVCLLQLPVLPTHDVSGITKSPKHELWPAFRLQFKL